MTNEVPKESDLYRLDGPAAQAWADENGNSVMTEEHVRKGKCAPEDVGTITVPYSSLGDRFKRAATFVKRREAPTDAERAWEAQLRAQGEAARHQENVDRRMDAQQQQITELANTNAALLKLLSERLPSANAPTAPVTGAPEVK